MIEERILADPIAKFLLERAGLTQAQLDTYLIDLVGKRDKIGLSELVSLRDRGPVKKGAFLRTLSQAHKNLMRAIHTIILAQYLGLLDKQIVTRLVEVGALMSTIDGRTLTGEQIERIVEALAKVTEYLR